MTARPGLRLPVPPGAFWLVTTLVLGAPLPLQVATVLPLMSLKTPATKVPLLENQPTGHSASACPYSPRAVCLSPRSRAHSASARWAEARYSGAPARRDSSTARSLSAVALA